MFRILSLFVLLILTVHAAPTADLGGDLDQGTNQIREKDDAEPVTEIISTPVLISRISTLFKTELNITNGLVHPDASTIEGVVNPVLLLINAISGGFESRNNARTFVVAKFVDFPTSNEVLSEVEQIRQTEAFWNETETYFSMIYANIKIYISSQRRKLQSDLRKVTETDVKTEKLDLKLEDNADLNEPNVRLSIDGSVEPVQVFDEGIGASDNLQSVESSSVSDVSAPEVVESVNGPTTFGSSSGQSSTTEVTVSTERLPEVTDNTTDSKDGNLDPLSSTVSTSTNVPPTRPSILITSTEPIPVVSSTEESVTEFPSSSITPGDSASQTVVEVIESTTTVVIPGEGLGSLPSVTSSIISTSISDSTTITVVSLVESSGTQQTVNATSTVGFTTESSSLEHHNTTGTNNTSSFAPGNATQPVNDELTDPNPSNDTPRGRAEHTTGPQEVLQTQPVSSFATDSIIVPTVVESSSTTVLPIENTVTQSTVVPVTGDVSAVTNDPTTQNVQPVDVVSTTVPPVESTITEETTVVPESVQFSVVLNNPSTEEVQSSIQESQPSHHEDQPLVHEVQLADHEIKPPAQEVQPIVQSVHPSVQEVQPSVVNIGTSTEVQPDVQKLSQSLQATSAVQPTKASHSVLSSGEALSSVSAFETTSGIFHTSHISSHEPVTSVRPLSTISRFPLPVVHHAPVPTTADSSTADFAEDHASTILSSFSEPSVYSVQPSSQSSLQSFSISQKSTTETSHTSGAVASSAVHSTISSVVPVVQPTSTVVSALRTDAFSLPTTSSDTIVVHSVNVASQETAIPVVIRPSAFRPQIPLRTPSDVEINTEIPGLQIERHVAGQPVATKA